MHLTTERLILRHFKNSDWGDLHVLYMKPETVRYNPSGYPENEEASKKIVIHEMIEVFDSNIPHPNGANLFYYPENYDARTTDISNYNPTVEEIVDKCLNYRPIML